MRPFQFHLRTMLLWTTVGAVVCGAFDVFVLRPRRRAALAAARLERNGAILFREYAHAPFNRCLETVVPAGRVSSVTFNFEAMLWEAMGCRGSAPRSSLGNSLLRDIGALYGVRRVILRGTAVSDEGLAFLGVLGTLEELDLTDTRIGDAGLRHLSTLRNLECLDVTGTNVTDSGIDNLTSLTNLKTLGLVDTDVTDAGVARLKKAIPGVRIVREHPAPCGIYQ